MKREIKNVESFRVAIRNNWIKSKNKCRKFTMKCLSLNCGDCVLKFKDNGIVFGVKLRAEGYK
jgi:hypothetical protein